MQRDGILVVDMEMVRARSAGATDRLVRGESFPRLFEGGLRS